MCLRLIKCVDIMIAKWTTHPSQEKCSCSPGDLGTYILTTWRIKKYSQAQLVNFLSLGVRNLNPKALCSLSLRSSGRWVCHIRHTLPRTLPPWHQTIKDWRCLKRSEIIFSSFHLRLGSLAKFSDFFFPLAFILKLWEITSDFSLALYSIRNYTKEK